jgi:alkaline phosphatase D
MKRNLLFYACLLLLVTSCDKFQIRSFKSDWTWSPDGVWVGPEYWANRLQDWTVRAGRLECVSPLPMRTVHLMTRNISDKRGNITSSLKIFLAGRNTDDTGSSAGLLIGAGRGLDFRAAALVFHSWGEKAGIYAGIDAQGNLFLRDFEKENAFLARHVGNKTKWTEVQIIVNIIPGKETSRVRLLAINPVTNIIIDKLEAEGIPSERLTGNIAIVSNAGYSKDNTTRYSFSDWKVSGSRIVKNDLWNTGPIVTAQYTLSKRTLKLTAQFMPVGNEDSVAFIQLKKNGSWTDAGVTNLKRPSFTALFRFDNWTGNQDIEYRVGCDLKRKREKQYYLYGVIRHDPADKNEIRLLSLSCCEQIIRPDGKDYRRIDAGYFNYGLSMLYPHNQLVENLKKQNADVLFFAGDQVYESASPTLADLENTYLDYLYKWYLWCLTYRDLTSNIPAITIPDDHDVYHGNLWGSGGKATPADMKGTDAQDAGGYKMTPDFVNMVQQTQTSHLPDPADTAPAEQGIQVYFTDCNIGGISMAVIEDRKFKTAPKALFPDADIYNGWPRNRYWNARYSARTEKAELLGDRQLAFLEKWSADWSGGAWMKVALSQTLLANLATIPVDSLTDDVVPLMTIPDSGTYLMGDRLATDFDSNGWPQNERDRAIRIFRKAFAIHIAGDLHLGTTVQYGVEDFRDACFAIISPATGNIWPRHWFPPSTGYNRKEGWPENYGDFEDGFGNKITVFAVANPHKSAIEPVRHNQVSTGYSMITFNRATRDIEMANWPYYADPEKDKPFPFWPVKINQADNYGKQASGWLPEIKVEGLTNPVVKVIREYTGELIYSIRISATSFQPKVFDYGNYRIEVGEPDEDRWQIIEKLYPTAFREREPLTIRF